LHGEPPVGVQRFKRVQGSGFWVQGSGFRVQRFRGSKVPDSPFRVDGRLHNIFKPQPLNL